MSDKSEKKVTVVEDGMKETPTIPEAVPTKKATEERVDGEVVFEGAGGHSRVIKTRPDNGRFCETCPYKSTKDLVLGATKCKADGHTIPMSAPKNSARKTYCTSWVVDKKH